MPRYLLDTNAVSDLINDPRGRVARAIERIGESSICTSIIVAGEVRFGAAKKKSRRLVTQIETAFAHLDIQPFAAPADRVYGELRADLDRSRCSAQGELDSFGVLYIGKAGGAESSATLRQRLWSYIRFGTGKRVGHWGGRRIWQLSDAWGLRFAWNATPTQEPRGVERRLLSEFVSAHRSRPFANLTG